MKWLKIISISFVLLLSGCNEVSEPNDLAYVVAIGIDEAEQENIYEITLQIANPLAISGGSKEEGGEGGEKTISEITVTAPTIFSAVNVVNHLNSKKISLSHTALIAFCDEIAKEGMKEFADTIGRSEELRPNTYISVVRGSAKEYLSSIKPTNEVNPVQYYRMIYGAGYTGFIPKSTSQEFYIASVCSCRDIVLPLSAVKEEDSAANEIIYDGFEYLAENYIAGEVEAESEEKTQSYGMAIISDGKMIAEASAIEAEMFNMLTGRYTQSVVTYKNKKTPDRPVTVKQSQQRKPKVRVKIVDGKPQIYVKIYMDADLSTVSGEYLIEEEFDDFESQATEEIKAAVDKFLEKTAAEYKSDIIGFGDYAKRSFKTYNEFMEYGWLEKYPESEFITEVEFHIRRSGLVDRKRG